MKMLCPHCNSKSKIRTSRTISSISRELYYQCNNIDCGHTWSALLSAIRTIVPSQCPNPKVYIPVSDQIPPLTGPPTG